MTASSSAGEEIVVPPSIPSGFRRRRREIFGGLFLLTVVYRAVAAIWSDATAAPAYCPDDSPCPRPDLLAFQVCSGIMQLYMGLTGFVSWHVTKAAHARVPATTEGRLFGYIPESDRLNAGFLVYQMFDFFASLGIPEHRTAVFLGHHALSALTAWMSLEYQLVHHYALFFGGCSELSSIFLVLCDYDVYFPASRGSAWGALIFFCQASFAILFFYYRIVGWIGVSVPLWRDCLRALKVEPSGGKGNSGGNSGGGGKQKMSMVDKYRPGKGWFLRAFLGMDVALGLLQIYWFRFGIVPKIMEVLSEEA